MNKDQASTLEHVIDCCRSWEPDVRLIGNARAGDIAEAIASQRDRLTSALELIGVLSSAIHIWGKGPHEARAKELFKQVFPPPSDRCGVCGWPLETSWTKGCVPGNCCMRSKE